MYVKRKYNAITLSLFVGALLLTAACDPRPKLDQSQYWQRVNASDSVFLQGPKVQQMLSRDIARCVTEIRELEGIGIVKDGIPMDKNGRVLDPDQLAIQGYDRADRDGFLLAEQSEYHDFETCMLAKGWDRTKYVPYEVSDEAKHNYYKTLHSERQKKMDAANKDRSSSGYNDYEVNE